MATGIILSIDGSSPTVPNGTIGTVQLDETGEVLSFVQVDFDSLGLNVKDTCSFDIWYDLNLGTAYATNLAKYIANPPRTITGPITGDLTANTGDVITVTGASAVVTGNIIINGGKIIVEQDAQVNGTTHSVVNGVFVARKGGQVKGGINVDGGGNLKIVNKGKIVGGINVQSGGRMIVGNDNGPGYINGTIDIVKIRRLDITADSKING